MIPLVHLSKPCYIKKVNNHHLFHSRYIRELKILNQNFKSESSKWTRETKHNEYPMVWTILFSNSKQRNGHFY